jgi:organic radical activating enzyme
VKHGGAHIQIAGVGRRCRLSAGSKPVGGFEVAIETNGTLSPPEGIDWICVSPKAGSDLVVRSGHELKLVHPQHGAEPERFESLAFEHFFLQPMDDLLRKQNTERVVAYCMDHPRWRLSLQTHKMLGIR